MHLLFKVTVNVYYCGLVESIHLLEEVKQLKTPKNQREHLSNKVSDSFQSERGNKEGSEALRLQRTTATSFIHT